jgi:hypothetical protein
VLLVVLGVVGCGNGGSGTSTSSPTTTPSPTPTAVALARAQAALLPPEQTPPAPPGTIVRDDVTAYTAQGDEVGSPWSQFMVCPIVTSHPDEGPPPASDVEPDALAGAWTFGLAGAAQLDQYAIVYADEAAAQAAVDRARARADECAGTYTANPDSFGPPPETQVGPVPESVAGFRVRALFTNDQGASQSDSVSTVMRVGDTVHYMRCSPSGYETATGGDAPNPEQTLDPQWTEQVIQAAADHLGG